MNLIGNILQTPENPVLSLHRRLLEVKEVDGYKVITALGSNGNGCTGYGRELEDTAFVVMPAIEGGVSIHPSTLSALDITITTTSTGDKVTYTFAGGDVYLESKLQQGTDLEIVLDTVSGLLDLG